MSEKIIAALKQLDPVNDAHWADNGEPLLEAVKAMSGIAKLTREQVTNVAPTLNRSTVETWLASVSPSKEKQAEAAAIVPLREQIEAEEASLRELDDEIERLKAHRDALVAAIDELKDQDRVENPPMTPAEAIRAHIEAQHAERCARAGVVQGLVGPNARLVGMSPVDAAFAARPKQHPNHAAPEGV